MLLLFSWDWISCVGATVNSFFFVAIFHCYYYHYLTHCASRSISFVSFLSFVHWLRASFHKWAKLEHVCDSFEKILFHCFDSMERKWMREGGRQDASHVWLLIKINAKIAFFHWPINIIISPLKWWPMYSNFLLCLDKKVDDSSKFKFINFKAICRKKSIYRICARYQRKKVYLSERRHYKGRIWEMENFLEL